MRLSDLLEGILIVSDEIDRDVPRLTLDSRRLEQNDGFLAIKGTHQDGRLYIPDVIRRGASVVFIDADHPNERILQQDKTLIIPIFQLKTKVSYLASRFYRNPAKNLRMLGVTGTNGKTSCTHFIAQTLKTLKIPCGVIGTLGCGFYGSLSEAGLTTPDAISLQRTLREFLEHEAKAVAMEVTSHSIDQGRVNDIDFEIAVFTNLTQDHLDYHGNMENYAAVKRRFLSEFKTKQLVINADDAYGSKWITELAPHKPVLAYATQKDVSHSISPAEFVYADHIQSSLEGITASIHSPWGEGELLLPLIGRFNLSNALAVLSALCLYGVRFASVLEQLGKLNSVPGRMQLLKEVGTPLVVVDYSHTPDALLKALQALRPHTEGKLWCVFGCGGERDAGKRPLMAKIAEQLADQVIVTNDNPRHEQPQHIAEDILSGFTHRKRVIVELDRSKAISNSIQWASAKDCILIAGKGAEHYQQIGDQKIPFDDVEQVSNNLHLFKNDNGGV